MGTIHLLLTILTLQDRTLDDAMTCEVLPHALTATHRTVDRTLTVILKEMDWKGESR